MSKDDDLSDKLKGAIWGMFFEETEERITKSQEKQVLKLAQAKGGVLTVSELALGTSLSLEEADRVLKRFASKGYAQMNVTDSGTLLYEFQGFTSSSKHQKTDPNDFSYSSSSISSSEPPQTSETETRPVQSFKSIDDEDQTNLDSDEKPPELEEEDIFQRSEQKTAEKPAWMKNRKGKKW